MKSVIGEISDETNQAQAFAVIPVSFAVGNTIASVAAFLYLIIIVVILTRRNALQVRLSVAS